MDAKERKHIHIVGCSPRSGTTLIQEMMVTCFEIDHHCEHERSLFKEEVLRCGVTCTKSPREVFYARSALRVDPDLYFIYMVRDPRDTIVSRHDSRPDIYYASLSFYLWADRYALRLVDYSRSISVRYEDLVRDPDGVQALIMKRLPFLKYCHPFSEFHLHAKVSEDSKQALGGVRPPDINSIGKWRKHLPRIAAQVLSYPEILEIIERYGYESDRVWLNELPAVDPELAKGAMRDHSGMAYEARLKLRIMRKTFQYWRKLRKTRCT